MRTSNPTLNDSTFDQFTDWVGESSHVMTLQGTVYKTGLLLATCICAAGLSWQFALTNSAVGVPMLLGGLLGGLVLSLVISFRPTTAPWAAPLYSIAEGLFLGAVSSSFEARFPGIVFPAVLLTFGTLASLLMAYQSGVIKATENFKLGIVAATGGIALVYIVSIVMSFFRMEIPLIHGSGLVGIGFSLFVVVIAALNLVLDFDHIEEGVKRGAPKYMEWYSAFALLVTLVWLYLEILRLLAKLQRRD